MPFYKTKDNHIPKIKQIARLLKLIAATALGFYIILCISVYIYQEKLIFFPDKSASNPPKGMGVEQVSIRTPDGETLSGWYMHGAAGRRTVLFFHGNGGSVAGLNYQIEAFRKLGLNGLIFDYRGYGGSSGRIQREADLYTDGNAAVEFLKSKGVPERDIIIWGQSLGGGVAADIAQNRPVNAVILDSTFYSMKEMARTQFPYLPTGVLLKYQLRTDEKLKNIHAPILVIHSEDDGIIPFAQGEKVFAAAQEPKVFLEVTGSHTGAYFDCEEIYLGGIREFLGGDR